MKRYTLILLLTAAPLFAGTQAPVFAPQSNTTQGFTLGLEPMAMRSYTSNSHAENNYDFAGRGSLGYQFADGLFVTASYFGYGTDIADYTAITSPVVAPPAVGYLDHYSGRLSASFIDLVVGQNFKPTDTLKLSPFVGLRWTTYQVGVTDTQTTPYPVAANTTTRAINSSHHDFRGLGIVLGIDATRALGNDFSIYSTAKESVIFGSSKTAVTNFPEVSSDTVVSISELGLGIQYDFCFSGVASNIRLGVEGQWWAISGNSSLTTSENIGLAGLVLGANFRF